MRPGEATPVGEVREPPEPVLVRLWKADSTQSGMAVADRVGRVQVPGGVEGEERHRGERPPEEVVRGVRVEELEEQVRAVGEVEGDERWQRRVDHAPVLDGV